MDELIDRDDERTRLLEAANAPPQLVVMRGRRRVGKSFLVDRALAGRRVLSFQADEQPERGHLDGLALEAARLLPGSPPLTFADWDTALGFVGGQADLKPLVLVLDEFQWMVQAQPALPSILQRHWDRWQRAGTPVTVVLTGSALTLMEELLGHGSPLFGRADYRPLIEPLDYRVAAAFARPDSTSEALLRRYAVLGGTPQYQVWAGRSGLSSILRDRILRKGESLYEEPLHLLREEQRIRDPGTYFAVLRAIAGGATQFNAIRQRARIERNLDVMLGRLEELGYIEKREPVEAMSKRSSYRIADPFFRFWFRYVFPNRSRLDRGRVDEVMAEVETDLDTFMGLAFEDCCRDWVGRYAPAELVARAERLGSWWARDGSVEIDLAAMTKDRYVLLGSCKWSRRARTNALADLLAARERLGGRAANASLAIFARGFDSELEEEAAREDVTLITADHLFA
ncbi:MAG TPA: ATP-binding protein [Solirubrobacteraceae bacterium]|nr:ATP-binding protein [Solirubrobacteraceae bacterium]